MSIESDSKRLPSSKLYGRINTTLTSKRKHHAKSNTHAILEWYLPHDGQHRGLTDK